MTSKTEEAAKVPESVLTTQDKNGELVEIKQAHYLYDGEFARGRFSPMTSAINDDLFCGALGTIVQNARKLLAGKSDENIECCLRLLDEIVAWQLQNDLTLVGDDGERIPATRKLLDRVSEADIAAHVISLFPDGIVIVGDDLTESEAKSDPSRCFNAEHMLAAFAIRECVVAAQYAGFADWDESIGAHSAIQASRALAQSELLAQSGAGIKTAAEKLREIADKRFKNASVKSAAGTRWARLDSVKQLAFTRRAQLSNLSRSAAIDRILPEILEAAKAAGEPLTGGTPKETIITWFRKAGIK